jgi:hypothetical protein
MTLAPPSSKIPNVSLCKRKTEIGGMCVFYIKKSIYSCEMIWGEDRKGTIMDLMIEAGWLDLELQHQNGPDTNT